MKGIRSFLGKWHNIVIHLNDVVVLNIAAPYLRSIAVYGALSTHKEDLNRELEACCGGSVTDLRTALPSDMTSTTTAVLPPTTTPSYTKVDTHSYRSSSWVIAVVIIAVDLILIIAVLVIAIKVKKTWDHLLQVIFLSSLAYILLFMPYKLSSSSPAYILLFMPCKLCFLPSPAYILLFMPFKLSFFHHLLIYCCLCHIVACFLCDLHTQISGED